MNDVLLFATGKNYNLTVETCVFSYPIPSGWPQAVPAYAAPIRSDGIIETVYAITHTVDGSPASLESLNGSLSPEERSRLSAYVQGRNFLQPGSGFRFCFLQKYAEVRQPFSRENVHIFSMMRLTSIPLLQSGEAANALQPVVKPVLTMAGIVKKPNPAKASDNPIAGFASEGSPMGPAPFSLSPQTVSQVLKFRDERDWKQFHTPKDLAISLSLEAAELLEVFQWSGSDTSANGKLEKIREELADVVSYAILMADACGLDLDDIVQEKVKRNAEKYPVEKARGTSKKYTEL